MKDLNLHEILEEYLKDKKIDDLFNNDYISAWQAASGGKLASSTELKKVDKENKTLVIKPNSTTTSALLKLERNRILEDWNKLLPSCPMEKIRILKSYTN